MQLITKYLPADYTDSFQKTISSESSIQVNDLFKLMFIEYPKCSTCQRAKKWLEQNEIPYTDRHIQEENPTYEELREWLDKSGLPLRKFFNTSGMLYKSMQLKDKLPGMSEEEQLRLLASDGMLVKRPIAVKGDTVLVGFTSDEWERLKG